MSDQQPEQDSTQVETTATHSQQTPTLESKVEKPTTAKATKAPRTANKPSNKLAAFALLLALLSLSAIGGGAWYWYQNQTQVIAQQQQWQLTQDQQLQQLEQQLKQQLNSSQEQLQQAQQQATALNQKAMSDNLSVVDAKIAEISGRQPSDWALAEANYLIRMAGRKLWLEDDLTTAQRLLATADLRIAELSNPSLLPIRQAIARDIATVRALPNPRVTDIHLTLSGLIDNLESLAINSIEVRQFQTIKSQKPQVSADLADWKENLKISLGNIFDQLFVINHGVIEGDVEPYKMPQQQWFLRANVRMTLLQAQTALLDRQQKVFTDSLQRAINWLAHFKATDSSVKAAKLTLQSLLTDPIVASYPEKFHGQVILEQTLRQRMGTVIPAKPQPAPQPESTTEEPQQGVSL